MRNSALDAKPLALSLHLIYIPRISESDFAFLIRRIISYSVGISASLSPLNCTMGFSNFLSEKSWERSRTNTDDLCVIVACLLVSPVISKNINKTATPVNTISANNDAKNILKKLPTVVIIYSDKNKDI